MKEAKKVKNIIFLKEVESNLIEEAIIILNQKINLDNLNKKSKFLNSEMVLKEARNIINMYSDKIEIKNENEVLMRKNKKLKIASIVLGITSIVFMIL